MSAINKTGWSLKWCTRGARRHGSESSFRAVCHLLMLLCAMYGLSEAAWAVPSYARQTGYACVKCHVGGFGPQLTPYGIKFKINGYTESDHKGFKLPLAAM